MNEVTVVDMPSATAPRSRGQWVARVLLGIVLILLGVFVLESFLRALAWAAILAVATWPLYARVKRRLQSGRAVQGGHDVTLPALFTLVTTLVVLVPLVVLAYQAGHEARTAAGWLHDARTNGIALPDALSHLPVFQAQVSGWWADNLAKPDGARVMLGRADQELMAAGRSYGGRVLHSAVDFGFTMLALFFLYRDGARIGPQLLGAATSLFGPHGERVARQMIASVHGTVDGLVLVGLGVGLVLGIGYAVAGVPHAILFGIATAGAAMVPFAAWFVLAATCLLVLASGSAVTAAVLGVFGVVVIFSADHFVRPVLIGGATKLPFLWVLLGILGGVETFGLLGLFLGPAIMAALILLWREWVGDARTAA